jgi:hypothetical protein
MVTLLQVVQAINEGSFEDDIPVMQGGSREVLQAYRSFCTLFRIVSGSNVAFFSGNLLSAKLFIETALNVFQKIDDEKAIGIAYSNLGNALHVMYYKGLGLDEGTSCQSLVIAALNYYSQAIQIAEKQLADCTNEKTRYDFTQQLADRLFNRVMLYRLVVLDGLSVDCDAHENSLADLCRVRELDDDVKTYWLEKGMLFETSSDHFNRLLQRSLGILEYYEDLQNTWNVDEIVQEADQFLLAAWELREAPIFVEVTRAGRLQQLESVALRLELYKGNKSEAVRMAMRMFVEDEYLVADAFKMSATALLLLFSDPEIWPDKTRGKASTKASFESDVRRMLKSCPEISLNIRKCVVFAFEVNGVWDGHEVMDELNSSCLSIFDDDCTDDDYVGVVAYTTRGDLNVAALHKEQYAGTQRAALDLATSSTSEQVASAVPYAIQMIMDCPVSFDSDSYTILVTDGNSWDSSNVTSIRHQIGKFNSERSTIIHLIIVGLEIEDPTIVEECKSLCSVSSKSQYIELIATTTNNTTNADAVFESVRRILHSGVVDNAYKNCLMMERF